jgi:hypothetical protein
MASRNRSTPQRQEEVKEGTAVPGGRGRDGDPGGNGEVVRDPDGQEEVKEGTTEQGRRGRDGEVVWAPDGPGRHVLRRRDLGRRRDQEVVVLRSPGIIVWLRCGPCPGVIDRDEEDQQAEEEGLRHGRPIRKTLLTL